MKSASQLLAIAALFASSGAGAQPAIYDGASGVLTIPSVTLGATTYGSVKLQNAGNYVFTLRAATEQPPLSTAEGIWRGLAAGSLTTTIILDDGDFYIFQAVPGSPNTIEGFTQGNSTSASGVFSAFNVKSFNFVEGEVITTGTLSASYQPHKWFLGSEKDDTGQTIWFGAHFDSMYDVVPSLSELAGAYTGQARFGPPFAVQALSATLNASGGVGGTIGGCAFSGTITPRPRGNLYNIAVTFGSGCAFPGQTFSGIAYLDPLMQRLMVAALNAQRSAAGMFIATK
jgi:hypothetical protein